MPNSETKVYSKCVEEKQRYYSWLQTSIGGLRIHGYEELLCKINWVGAGIHEQKWWEIKSKKGNSTT